ncbi:PEP-CTERM sorting domain-containing protein [Armatimonas sp.]|uniref:virginiamycin B lyase family protein n=1 Tax=Armatimonas sp. TaxID=1872638 RepID=UPI00374D7110
MKLFLALALLAGVALAATNAHAQDLYVGNNGNNSISQITPGGVVSQFIPGGGASGPFDPRGLVFDPSGNLYVSNFSDASVSKITPGGVITKIIPFNDHGLNGPWGIAFDTSGDLYVASHAAGNGISKYTSSGTFISIFATGVGSPTGIAFDTTGNLFTADFSTGAIYRITPLGVRTTFVAGGGVMENPRSLAFDASGNLYASSNGDRISQITPGGVVSTFVSGIPAQPEGLAFDASGSLYVGSGSGSSVRKILFSSPGVFDSISIFATGAPGGMDRPIGLAFKPVVASVAPEPGTLGLLALGGTLALVRRRGRKQEA